MKELITLILGIVGLMITLSMITSIIDLKWGGNKDTFPVYGRKAREILNA